MREKTGGVVYKQEVGREGGGKRERGKEKTRLPQHDLQIALSPWRLLSALPSIQSGSPNNLRVRVGETVYSSLKEWG